MRQALHRGLYDPDQQPALNGVRCDSCGGVFFPPQRIGCEVCGAGPDSLVPARLEASGTVRSVATVHRHGGKGIAAPFTIAEIQLDDGPLIRVTLTDLADPSRIGARAAGQWVTTAGDTGDEVVELRFALAGQ